MSNPTSNELKDFSEWKQQIEKLRRQLNPRFTVIPVEMNQTSLKTPDELQISSLNNSVKPSYLTAVYTAPEEGVKPHSTNSPYPNTREVSPLSTDDRKYSSDVSEESDKKGRGATARVRTPQVDTPEITTDEETGPETSMALVPVNNASWALEKYHDIPPSLVPIFLPRGFSNSPQSTSRNTSLSNPLARLALNPHGATIPSLHEMKGSSQNLALRRLLKESQMNIEYGTTDGRNLKVFSGSKTSSQLLGSGSIRESHPRTKGDRRHQYVDNGKEKADPNRSFWKSKLAFILACTGACVGLGSFWRLPYLCLVYGRAAFFVPYFIIFCIVGTPLLLAELVLGQFTQWGPIEAMKRICPFMQGVGVGLLFISLFSSVYYSLIFTESIHSLGLVVGQTFTLCNNTGALICVERDQMTPNNVYHNLSENLEENIDSNHFLFDLSDSSTETVVTLVVTLIGSWVIVYFALWKSVRSISKVTPVSATVPFLLIAAFTWRALTLPGATMGLQYLFMPEWKVLGDADVWVNAGVQVLINLNIVFGSSVVFASYNKFWNNVTSDVWIISSVSVLSTMMAVLVAFAGFGSVAFESGHKIEDIDFEAVDFAFVIYPHILSKMPKKNIWAALFFLLLLLLGLDSQFAAVEVIVTSAKDRIIATKSETNFRFFSKIFSKQEILVFLVCVLCFLCSLPFVLQGHTSFAHKKSYRSINMALLFLALCETVALTWLYGPLRLRRCILQMTAKPPSQYYIYCWKVATPITLLALWICSLATYHIPEAEDELSSSILAWVASGLAILPVPVCAFISFCSVGEGSLREKLAKTLSPADEVNHYPSHRNSRDSKPLLTAIRRRLSFANPKKGSTNTKYFTQKRLSAPL